MNSIFEKRAVLKGKLRRRERLFAGWVSYAHPSITETFARAGFDFIAIDMEHSTITVEQAQRIIAACQSEGCHVCHVQFPTQTIGSSPYLSRVLMGYWCKWSIRLKKLRRLSGI